jgi:transcriptional regulator with XRE-family HTH domain
MLKKWMVDHEISARDMAEATEYSMGTIYNIIQRKNMPSLRLAKKIEELTNGDITTSYLRNPQTYIKERCPECGKPKNFVLEKKAPIRSPKTKQ